MPEVSEMVWNDFFSHFSLNADGSRSYDGVQVKRNAVFADAKGHWAQNAIGNTVAEGLFSSVTDTSFAPNTSATRGMLMTVLARYAGTDTTGGATWYEKGMEWVKRPTACPTARIRTPTSLVSSSSPCCIAMQALPKADGKLDSFSDFASVSSYAENAMQWAVANGIVNGSNGKLNPQNNATRAEVAAILMRFCEMSK